MSVTVSGSARDRRFVKRRAQAGHPAPGERRSRRRIPGGARYSRPWHRIGAAVVFALPIVGCGRSGALVEAWEGECPYEEGGLVTHIASIHLSASESSPELIESRLAGISDHARHAVDCEAPFVVAVIVNGRVEVIFDETVTSPLGTETARDLQVVELADGIVDQIRGELKPLIAAEPPSFSDPGLLFRFLDERQNQLDPGQSIAARVYADGITQTEEVDLNRSLEEADLGELAERVAPGVDLEGEVSIDWRGLGLTTDETGPPASWVGQLSTIWATACTSARTSACNLTTTT